MARKTSCETFSASDEFAMDVCITTRASPGRSSLQQGQQVSDWLHKAVNIAGLDREKYWAIALDTRLHPLALLEIFTGGVSSSIVDPVLLFRRLLQVPLCNAAVLIHNHPSGEARPSPDDERLILLLEGGARSIGLRILDHLIVTADPGVWFSSHQGHGGGRR